MRDGIILDFLIDPKNVTTTKKRSIYKAIEKGNAGLMRIKESDVTTEDGEDNITPEKEEKRIALKSIIKVQDEFNGKFDTINTVDVDSSRGDVRNLPNKVFTSTFVPIIENVKSFVKASTGTSSVYVEQTEDLLKQIQARKPEFMKAYRKKNGSLTKMTYRCAVFLLLDLITVISDASLEMYKKELKSFDDIISKNKDNEGLFRYSTALSDMLAKNKKVYVEEMKIVESSLMDSPLHVVEGMQSLIRENSALSISSASRLINYGLSNTVYKLFAIIRYVIYLNYYRKYSFADRIAMINKNIEVLDHSNTQDSNSALETAEANSRNFKVDTIEASNKAHVETSKGETIDLDF